MSFQLFSGRCRAGKGNRILRNKMIQQISGFIGSNKLNGAFGQNSGFNDILKNRMSKIRSGWRRFYDTWKSGNNSRSQFFHHSPNWKIKRVDVNSNSMLGNANMLSGKSTATGKSLVFALHMPGKIGEFAPGFG